MTSEQNPTSAEAQSEGATEAKTAAPEGATQAPELFPGEHALARTKAGSRDEMRVLRTHYNWVNMTVALAVCMVCVLIALMFAPRPQGQLMRDVDYAGAAETAQGRADFTLTVPDLPPGFHANAASLSPQGAPAFDTWYVSWVSEDDMEWVSMHQALGDERWVRSLVPEREEAGREVIAGQEFTLYAGRSEDPAWVTELADGSWLIITAIALNENTRAIAESAVKQAGR